MMKDFQDIQNINIRLAQKFEKMGYFKEADEIDNMNLMLSQRITIATGPEIDKRFQNVLGELDDRKITFSKVLRGIEKGLQKLTGKTFNFPNASPGLNIALSRFFLVGGLLFETGLFFVELANDASGTFGDSDLDKAKIARSLVAIVQNLSFIASGFTGPLASVATTIGFIATAINIGLTAYIAVAKPTDDYDQGKKPYPGTPENFVQEAYSSRYPNSKNTFKSLKSVNSDIIKELKKKITEIASKNNYTLTSARDAFMILDSKFGGTSIDRKDLANEYNLKPLTQTKKPNSKPTNDPANRPREYDFGQYSP